MQQLSSFCELWKLRRWSVLLIFVLQTFSWNHSPICFVSSPLSSLETFWSICVACVVKGLLLDIGRNLCHSLVLQSQISNFPHSLTKSVFCVKLFLLKNFTLSLNEALREHYFCFLHLLNVLLFSKNQIRLLCQTPKAFSTVKLALYVKSLCLLLHNNLLGFNISDNCWKSSHNLWTLPNPNSRSFEGVGFRACYLASAQSPTDPFRKSNVLGELQKSVDG